MSGRRSKRKGLSSKGKRTQGLSPALKNTLNSMPQTSSERREPTQSIWPPRYVSGIQQLSPFLKQAFHTTRVRAERSRRRSDQTVKILSCISDMTVLSRLQSSTRLKRQLRLHLKLHDLGKDYDLDDVACEKVTDCDSRKSLRDGWKVVAQRDFDALEVVGPYKGWVSSLKEYEDTIPLIQRLQFEQHLVSTSSTVDLSSSDCANVLSEINDAVTVEEDGETIPGSGARNNCEIVEIGWRGWVYVFIVTIRSVRKGDELTVTYGEDYWRGIQKVKRQHKEVRECMGELAQKAGVLESLYDVLRGKTAPQDV